MVATPIGAARDITLRALDILAAADVIAAEDTRTARKLLSLHGVSLSGRRLIPYHDHNGPAQRPILIGMLAAGKSVAYVSDAGTPLVADPGFALVRDAVAAGYNVVAAPGPSALLNALVVSGLPTDKFLFAGFLPATGAAREAELRILRNIPATLVFFESPRRCLEMLKACVAVLGEERRAALCRELTKKFEETRRATLGELLGSVETDPPKGEIVVLIDRGSTTVGPEERDTMLRQAMETMSVKDAARHVSEALGLPRREVYQAALELGAAR